MKKSGFNCTPRRNCFLSAVALLVLTALGASAQNAVPMQEKLEASLQELSNVRNAIAREKLPMVKGLNALEDEVMEVRLEHQKIMRQLDSRNLDLNNLRSDIKSRKGEKNYISNLLVEYTRNFETRLHIAELDLYENLVKAASLAPENSNLSDQEIFVKQTELVETSIQRLQEIVGGSAFAGTSAGEDGLVKQGNFLLIGPVALFASEDGSLAGIAEQRLGSLEPTVLPFADPLNTEMVKRTVAEKKGIFPFDPSLGNARKIEETRETFKEHLAKGGKVGYVIVGMFVLCVAISIFKVIQLLLVPKVSESRAMPVLKAILVNDHKKAAAEIGKLRGPTAVMLTSGIEHITEPKELVEEVMYEEMLTTRMRVNKFTPVLAVCASTAPLMGLLGTVTGIINTFKMITVFGSGDVKTLSGGISEALVTTEMGLVVAISALVMYAFLSRMAKKITDQMEQVAILFINRSVRAAGEAEEATAA
ncbi:MotA/TolQ/ExbB proton channel family protein [Pontiella agarivorans]|uniref:MotA/TolQ/ExbB proton channel family protein n=1 Tax=Pontiella agarivorans TaxID=3038953 RepID=A0ABU5N1A4_9BACT|nr:MotA/TolQ/ExbB proton channel family protein [Pontiella agarivorans]MDZ8120184.1 MotA/TolQ/ExbB proton channel family protein [Pontiella agarivorans]